MKDGGCTFKTPGSIAIITATLDVHLATIYLKTSETHLVANMQLRLLVNLIIYMTSLQYFFFKVLVQDPLEMKYTLYTYVCVNRHQSFYLSMLN